MTSGNQKDGQSEEGNTDRTALAAGRLVKYSRELNRATTVDEVGGYALEAGVNALEGTPSMTVVEVRDDDLRTVASMPATLATEDGIPVLAREARARDRTVVAGDAGVERVSAVDVGGAGLDTGAVAAAAPSVFDDGVADTGVVIVAVWDSLERLAEYHVKPLEYLSDYVATAVTNIRSRERLERARTDLEKRKEMLEVYDRLLRHDLGNDLQVVTSLTNGLLELLNGEAAEYAERIQTTASNAGELIKRVGSVIKQIEEESEPEPRSIRAVVTAAAEEAETKFDGLAVSVETGTLEGEVYAGDLLESVFVNIISNAAVHNETPVTVRVTGAEPSPERMVVTLADDGSGVPEELREEVFEMGRKGPDSEGSGFGLGLARALLESYGGSIEVEESEAGGAAFRVSLQRP